MTTPRAPVALDMAAHRQLGVDLYNRTWTLLETADRTPDQVDEMIAAAHASAWHWAQAGGTVANSARSHWLMSRVYSILGRGEPALWHARRCVALAERAVAERVAVDWDMPAALEALARAQAAAGDGHTAAATLARARDALAAIADPEDRDHIAEDLASIAV